MERKRLLIVGLDEKEVDAIKLQLDYDWLVVVYDMLPVAKLSDGELFVESPTITGKFLKVDKVVFHGIFENDYDFITMLALWGGPCLPDAVGMMDLRQRIPGLARALKITRFGSIKRGMVIGSCELDATEESVAKWGIWHCGEDKHKFTGKWTSTETSVIEKFIEGEAVRIMLVGDKHWQIRLTGNTWLKSIHNEGSWEMEINQDLLADSQAIAQHFGFETVGIDYMLGNDGTPYLLEVNHIPNVTVFPFVNEAFISFAAAWIRRN